MDIWQLLLLFMLFQNSYYSELVHSFIVLFSFLPLLLAIPFGEFPVFVITSFLAAGIDCVFLLLQRYNRPRILRLLARKEARP